MSEQDLRNMKTGEVAERARQAGIQNVEKMNKEQLLQALGQQGPESAKPGRGGGQGDTPPPEGTDPREWKNIPGNQS
jgi:hypothetical protein